MAAPPMSKTNTLVARIVPPENSTVIGQTPDGRTLYKRTIVYGEKVPIVDENGTQVWQLHPTTAQPMYPKFKLQRKEREQVFTLYDAGNGQVMIEEYQAPTEAELREREMVAERNRIKEELATRMAERGITVDDLLNVIQPGESEPEDEAPRRGRRRAA